MSEDFDSQVTSYLNDLADNERIERPKWKYDKKTAHSHYQSREGTIYVYSWFLFLWNLKPEKRDLIWEIVSFELAHNFKHYYDDYHYKQGHSSKGRKIAKNHKDMPFVVKLMLTMPLWEVEANKYAHKKTRITDDRFEELYKELVEVFRGLPRPCLDAWDAYV
jgi:hypothetical protein